MTTHAPTPGEPQAPPTRGRARGRRLLATAAALAVMTLAGACGDDSDADTDAGTAAGDAASGEAVYAEHCAVCHGADLRGTQEGPSHLSRVYEPGHHPDEAFEQAIRQGSRSHHWDFGDMPPVPGLSDDEIDAVIAYIREQQEAQGFEPYPPS